MLNELATYATIVLPHNQQQQQEVAPLYYIFIPLITIARLRI